MPLNDLPYGTINMLIRKNLCLQENLATSQLIKKLKPARKRGWLLKQELVEICYWKSPRAILHIKSNSSGIIRKRTQLAFSNKNEELKMKELIHLTGVSLPMASAILMLIYPKEYGVIDIRVWEVLHKMGIVGTNRRGINFNLKEWLSYLEIIRDLGGRYRVPPRSIERTLFNVHKKYQAGTLYSKPQHC